jgi:lipoate-protein ligase B
MLITSKDIISNDYSINVETKRGELMGLWSGHNKFASLGQEINRFVTMHGMAISFKNDLQMFSAINTSNPCGLTSSTYQSVESLSNQEISQGCIEDFNNKELIDSKCFPLQTGKNFLISFFTLQSVLGLPFVLRT